MGQLLNFKHETMAEGLATGMNQDTAYEKAGYKSDRSHASRLAANGNILSRVVELRAGAAERAKVTIDDIVRELDEIHDLARERHQYAVCVSATMNKAKILGLIVHKSVVLTKTVYEMNEAELKVLLGEA